MSEPMKGITLANGKTGIEWTSKEKPCVGHWYLCKDSESDYLKITKDYYCEPLKTTFYRIVEYYNGDILYVGHTLAQIREILRDNTYRMVI